MSCHTFQGTKKVISHGDVLRIGANKLLVHIHPGRETCGQCDPSEIQAAMELKAASEAAALAEAEKQTPSPQTDATVDGNGDTSKAKEGWKKVSACSDLSFFLLRSVKLVFKHSN